MDKAYPVAAELDARTFAELKHLSRQLDVSIDHLVATAVLRFVSDEMAASEAEERPAASSFAAVQPELAPLDAAAEAMRAFVRKGLDDIEAGRVIPHDEVMRQLRARYRDRSAA